MLNCLNIVKQKHDSWLVLGFFLFNIIYANVIIIVFFFPSPSVTDTFYQWQRLLIRRVSVHSVTRRGRFGTDHAPYANEGLTRIYRCRFFPRLLPTLLSPVHQDIYWREKRTVWLFYYTLWGGSCVCCPSADVLVVLLK